MIRKGTPGLTIPAVLGALLAAGGLSAQELTEATYEKWRDHVLPSPGERRYQALTWRPSFWEAVVEAHTKEMPVLLWAMNGHPLCNT
jgi:hypothetical protein